MNEELEQAEITKRVFTDKRDFPLSTIRDMFSEGDIIPQPDYQRDYVMDDRRASKLVESLIMGIPIPTVYLCEENDGTYSVIDGQQRMTSFVRFLNNDFSLKGLEELTELNGKKFKDLDKTYQRTIKSSSLNSIILTKESQELKYEIFARLNQGSLRLKPQELRNCIYRGSFNNMLEEIAESNKLLPILFLEENKRKNYQEYILRFYALRNYLEYSTSMTKTMNDYMSKHQNDEEKEIENAKKLFNKTIDIVKQVFGDTAFCVYDRSKKDFIRKFSGPVYDSIIIACSYFDNHDLMVNSDEIRSQVLEVRKNNADYQDFTYAATGSKNRVIGRINMIYNIIANIIGKPADGDIKRIFTTDEKEELWNSSEKHICSYCGQEILDISDAEVDHINPYTNGGETELSNAQLLHRHCNREKSSKTTELDTVDFEDEEDNE